MNTPQDPEAVETVQTKETPAVAPAASCSAGWFIGEPPHDGRTVVIMGRLTRQDEDGGGSRPILCESHYGNGWIDNDGLSIAEYYGETLHIDWWIPLPNAKESGSGL
jgi:hypothetical protein